MDLKSALENLRGKLKKIQDSQMDDHGYNIVLEGEYKVATNKCSISEDMLMYLT